MSEDDNKPVVEPNVREDQIDDYQLSRAIYAQLIQHGMKGLDRLSEIAEESEHPRCFEILGTYIKNIGDLNDKLLDNQRKIQVINQEQGVNTTPVDPGQQVEFTGSTKDIVRMLKDLREEPQDAEFTEVEDGTDDTEA